MKLLKASDSLDVRYCACDRKVLSETSLPPLHSAGQSQYGIRKSVVPLSAVAEQDQVEHLNETASFGQRGPWSRNCVTCT